MKKRRKISYYETTWQFTKQNNKNASENLLPDYNKMFNNQLSENTLMFEVAF